MKLFITLLSLFSLNALAIEFEITNLCDDKPYTLVEISHENFKNVGEITLEVLNLQNIKFKGNLFGISSMLKTPTGMEAIEVISNTEMKSYGWCYYVDGHGPDVLMNEYPIDENTKTVRWVFGYAHYKGGQWRTYCTPVFKHKEDFICSK